MSRLLLVLLVTAPLLATFSAVGAPADDARGERRRALAILDGEASIDCAPKECAGYAVNLLKSAALAGDRAALVALEQRRLSGAPDAPTAADMVTIEIALAEKGDPVAALRLARRYESGDGVAPNKETSVRWLTIVAERDAAEFPKAADAAYRLCELHGQGFGPPADIGKARRWCQRAAGAGHMGAALALAQLQKAGG